STVYFQARLGGGPQLWRSDGTEAGTVQLSEISQDPGYSASPWITAGPDRLYFVADDLGDRELWTSDGTSGGTYRVKDIHTSGSADPEDLVVAAGRLFFTAEDGLHGRELWTSDGTDLGTFLVSDLLPGPLSSGAALLGADGNRLFIRGSNGTTGNELWVVDALAVPTETLELPGEIAALSPPWPNPFTSTARMELTLPQSENVRIEVFDLLGRRVDLIANGWMPAGKSQSIELDGTLWASGVYFVRVSAADTYVSRSIIKSR
ncbi:MAG: T9SS type A sorting domain-containing protein, partial [Rhodothermales bacterium]